MRASIVEPYLAFIVETLTKYPTLRASGSTRWCASAVTPARPITSARSLRGCARGRRQKRICGYARLPGEQAQVDWAHFGKLTIGRAVRPLMAFVMVLSYSRHLFLRFYLGASMSYFIRGHVEAFAYFKAVPRVLLYDNLKSAVLERVGDAIRFHPTLLELAAHYRFQPRPVAVARGNEKGRVERAIRFARDAFFAARTFRDLDDLNAQAAGLVSGCGRRAAVSGGAQPQRARGLCRGKAASARLAREPVPGRGAHRGERAQNPLRALRFERLLHPSHPRAPHAHRARHPRYRAHPRWPEVIATHPRSFDRGAQIEDPAHIEALVAHKRAARAHRAQDRLHHAAPSAKPLFLRAAERGAHLGVLTRGLLQLLDTHGAQALEAAIAAALAEDAAHLGAVRHFIDAHAHARGQRPPIAVVAAQRSAAATLKRACAAVKRLRTTHQGVHR